LELLQHPYFTVLNVQKKSVSLNVSNIEFKKHVEVSNLLGNKYFTPQQYSLKHCIHNTNLAALSDRGERRSSRTVNESDFQSQRAQNTRNLDS